MGRSLKTHLMGSVTSELNKWELASDTVKSQQTLEPIAVLDEVTDRDLKAGLVLKFSEEQILLMD